MSDENKIAVLMASYNGASYIKEQIDSILNQVDVDLTLYISVDLSDDDTIDICKSYQKLYSDKVVLLPYGQRFGSAGVNFFRLINDVDLEKYGFISFSDQDDYWFPSKLKNAVEKIKKMNVKGYSANAIAHWPGKEAIGIIKSQPQKKYDYLFESAGHGCTYVFDSCALQSFKVQMVAKADIICKIKMHDWLIYHYFRENNLPWYIDNQFCMLYRQHQNNEFGANKGFKGYLSRIRKVREGWLKQQMLLNTKFVGKMPFDITSKLCLLKNINQLRRRPRDVFIMALLLLLCIY